MKVQLGSHLKIYFSQNLFVIKRFFRFGLTGLFVTGIHFAVAIWCVEMFQLSPPLANGVAFILATIVSFIVNTIWSFSAQLHGEVLFRFVGVSIVGFFSAMMVAWLVQTLGFGYLVGVWAVAIAIPPLTFILHNFWTYK